MFPPIVWPKAKEDVPVPVPFSARLEALVKVRETSPAKRLTEPSVFERLSAPRQPRQPRMFINTTTQVPLAAKDTNTSASPVRKVSRLPANSLASPNWGLGLVIHSPACCAVNGLRAGAFLHISAKDIPIVHDRCKCVVCPLSEP